LRQILTKDGFKSLYRGLGPAIIGSGASWGFYFYFYNHAKRRYESKLNVNELPGPYLMLSALEAGTISVLLTNPIWLLKTRLQLEPQQQFNNPAVRPYKGAFGMKSSLFA
jgi:solute carrier family 25 folate transporter 32